jgi:hypothetical protein
LSSIDNAIGWLDVFRIGLGTACLSIIGSAAVEELAIPAEFRRNLSLTSS